MLTTISIPRRRRRAASFPGESAGTGRVLLERLAGDECAANHGDGGAIAIDACCELRESALASCTALGRGGAIDIATGSDDSCD